MLLLQVPKTRMQGCLIHQNQNKLCGMLQTRCYRSIKLKATLREHHQQLGQIFYKVLTSDEHQQQQVDVCVQLVHAGVAALYKSQDWMQLLAAFKMAEDEVNRPISLAAFADAAPKLEDIMAQGAGMARAYQGTAIVRNDSKSSSSSWGFALRQPASRTASSAKIPSLTQPNRQQQQQQQQQQGWTWSNVQQLLLIGLGSLGTFRRSSLHQVAQEAHPSGTSTASPTPSRLGFRVSQLVLASALLQHLQSSLQRPPLAYDPEYDDFDRALLHSLGMTVPRQEPAYSWQCCTLAYMPCCPRDLYSHLLASAQGDGRLQHLGILGTSLRSLADTQGLFTALTNPAGGLRHSIGTSPSCGSSSSSSNDSWRGCAPGSVDWLQLLYQQEGRVIEMVCPDCAAHGVGVALHLFPPVAEPAS